LWSLSAWRVCRSAEWCDEGARERRYRIVQGLVGSVIDRRLLRDTECRCYARVFQKLGKLHITSCLEMVERRLTINLIKADDLPKWGISGPPGEWLSRRGD
jgi:hypothetical protein